MSDIDHAIASWREEMAERGLRQAEILDELESHLRDELQSQLRAGLGAQDAFDAAVKHIGHAQVLKHEFAKAITLSDRLRNALLTFAGIPNHHLATTMNTSHPEPAWATYLKTTAFLLPAIFLAIVSGVWVVPKLQQLCADAGLPTATAGTFWNLTHSSIQTMLVISQNGLLIAGAAIVLLLLLEWRAAHWPRYRRAVLSCTAFILNSIILLAFFMMFLAAILAAPAPAQLPQ